MTKTPSMTASSVSFGDVIVVDYPFSDAEESKARPAVIISTPLYHAHKEDALLLAITGRLKVTEALGEVLVQDWQQAGLLKPSALKAKIATVARSRFLAHLGRLSERDQIHVKNLLARIIDVIR
jgi:mRNA interferase MazF